VHLDVYHATRHDITTNSDIAEAKTVTAAYVPSPLTNDTRAGKMQKTINTEEENSRGWTQPSALWNKLTYHIRKCNGSV
jgi:hypothetical protein